MSASVSAVFIVILCAGTSVARAQFPDLAEISVQALPGVSAQLPPEAGDVDAEVQISTYEVVVNAPIILSSTDFLIFGATYHVDSVSYHGFPEGSPELGAFHAIDFPVMYVKLLPKDWSLAARVAPGLAGDLSTVNAGSFRLSAALLATHAFSDSFVFGFGGLMSYGFGELLPLPALYVKWEPSRYFRLETFLPAFINAVYMPTPGVELGLRADVAGSTYQVTDPRVRGVGPCGPGAAAADGGDRCLDHLAYSVVSVGGSVGVRLWESLWLSAFAGATVYRRFDAKTASGGAANDGGQDLGNAPIIRMSLTMRIPQ